MIFFNIVQPDEDRVICIVGDVSDKGISAALSAAYFQSMFESLATRDTSPSRLMPSLKDLIIKHLREGDVITAVIALFDLQERSVTIARAGHNWPLYCHADKSAISELKPKGMSIGVLEDEGFFKRLEEQKVDLQPGDLLLLYSDGVSEATGPDERMFELSRLKSVIERSAQETSHELIERINLRLADFMQNGEPADNATMMAIKFNQPRPGPAQKQ